MTRENAARLYGWCRVVLWPGDRARLSLIQTGRTPRGRSRRAINNARVDVQYAEELAELQDGSIGLFVTLSVFRSLMVSNQRLLALGQLEQLVAEHLAHLDVIPGDMLVRRDR
jgi:hypothetical protein